MSDSTDSLNPEFIREAEGNSVRARLVEVEHETQPGTRKNNAVHIELFDRIKIGRLKRIEDDMPCDGNAEERRVDKGIFLCGRSGRGIKVFHAEDDGYAICKKCRKIAHRLMDKGLNIFTYTKEGWDTLQEVSAKFSALNMLSNVARLKEFEPIPSREALRICREQNASVYFNEDDTVQINFRKAEKVIKGKDLDRSVTVFKKKEGDEEKDPE